MNKIAVISDVHGNLEALKKVLKDIEERHVDLIICLGDIIGKGNFSNESLNLLENAIHVYGNWEEFFAKKMCSNENAVQRHNLLNEKLSSKNKELIKNMKFSYELYISGRLVRFFHATPTNVWDNVLAFDRLEKLYNQFLPSDLTESTNVADVVVYAHTHTPNMMKLYNRTLINIGSVGNAFDIIDNEKKNGNILNTTTADYLLISGEIDSKEYTDINYEFISLKYDINKELESGKDNPEYNVYSNELINGKFRNVNKYKNNFEESFYNFDEI